MSYLVKKLDNAHVVWFEASNQWVKFDEPQWLIFSFYVKGTELNEAANKFAKKYSTSQSEAAQLVGSFYKSLGKLFNPDFSIPDFCVDSNFVKSYQPLRTRKRYYSFKNKAFSIVYGSPSLEKYIHLPIKNLETEEGPTGQKFEVFVHNSKYVLKVGEQNAKFFAAQDSGQLKRLLYIEMANFFYEKNASDWLAFIHGSAVLKNDEVLILTSEGGSGKSTMAGLLLKHGFELFSDDFIPVDSASPKVFPFPASLCVKNDAISMLKEQGFTLFEPAKSNLAYVVQHRGSEPTKPCKKLKVVFIKYNSNVDFQLNPISTLEALYHFFQEGWVGNDLKRARKFISWFSKLEFYRLEFSNNGKAIHALTDLVGKHEK